MVYRLAIVTPPHTHTHTHTENHFRSHFSPFQNNAQLFVFLIFFTKWLPVAILDHFRSHFSPFQINTQFFFTKWLPAAILDDRKSLSIAFLAISDQYKTFFVQNGCRRPFWMTENHFRSHFSRFQINTQLFFFTKWLPAAILHD